MPMPKNGITQNFGRARDTMPTLDATKHLVRAIPILTNQYEQFRCGYADWVRQLEEKRCSTDD